MKKFIDYHPTVTPFAFFMVWEIEGFTLEVVFGEIDGVRIGELPEDLW